MIALWWLAAASFGGHLAVPLPDDLGLHPEVVRPEDMLGAGQDSSSLAPGTMSPAWITPQPAQVMPRPAFDTPQPVQVTPRSAKATTRPAQDAPRPAQNTRISISKDDGPVASVSAAPSPIRISIEPIPQLRSLGGLVSAYPGLARVDVYGATERGTQLSAIRLGLGDSDRPCIVVVADPLAPREAGRDATLMLASQLLDRLESNQDGDVLCQVDWWLVSDPHPDRDTEADRTARIGHGFLAGWSPWGTDLDPGLDPGPWPLFDTESRSLAIALGQVPGAAAALVLAPEGDPFAGGRAARHCRDHLGWLTSTTGLDGTLDLAAAERLARNLPALKLTAPRATDLGEGLWLVEHDLYAAGVVSERAAKVDLTWSGATVVALARSVTQRGPERTEAMKDAVFDVVRHRSETARVDGPEPGRVQRLRWVIRVPLGSAPALTAAGACWNPAHRTVEAPTR